VAKVISNRPVAQGFCLLETEFPLSGRAKLLICAGKIVYQDGEA
jgi:hypothetical protein